MSSKTTGLVVAVLSALTLTLPVAAVDFKDVLDLPARPSALAAKGMLNGLALAGNRLLAAGERGHILYSDDAGKSWQQANVPVSSDLLAIVFPVPEKGWAVGHDGVVLHSADGGKTWIKQLDGRGLGQIVAGQGPENSFLDVWFANENVGYVVGSFNLVLRTDDGGRSWKPWLDRTENPNRLHLYAIRSIGNDVYIAGEQGLILKLDAAKERFNILATPYKGTYFGIVGAQGSLVAFGLRGNAYRSDDAGGSWRKMETGLQEGLTAGTLVAGKMVLVSQAGKVLIDDGRGELVPLKMDRTAPASAVVAIDPNTVVLAGARGVRVQALR